MTKAGAAIANGRRYAEQLILLTAYPNNTPAARNEARQSQGAWHNAVDELRTADTRGRFRDTSGWYPGLRTPNRTSPRSRDRDAQRAPAERRPATGREQR